MGDRWPPSVPTGLQAVALDSSRISLAWDAATDEGSSGLAGYKIFRDGLFVGIVLDESYTDEGLADGTSYSYSVLAFDHHGNESELCVPQSATSHPLDTSPPTVPLGLQGRAKNASSVLLEWLPSVDEGGGTLWGYNIFRNGTLITTIAPSGTSREDFLDIQLQANAHYAYEVTAYDLRQNESNRSAVFDITTPDPEYRTVFGEFIPEGLTVFVVDRSGSMNEIPAPAVPVIDWNGNYIAEPSMLTIVKCELIAALEAFSEYDSVALVSFGGGDGQPEWKWYMDALNVDLANKDKILNTVKTLVSAGFSPIYTALQKGAQNYGHNVTTFVFISDGIPNRDSGVPGELATPDLILSDFPTWYEPLKNAGCRLIVINTSTLPESEAFMRQLAQDNNGTYRDASVFRHP